MSARGKVHPAPGSHVTHDVSVNSDLPTNHDSMNNCSGIILSESELTSFPLTNTSRSAAAVDVVAVGASDRRLSLECAQSAAAASTTAYRTTPAVMRRSSASSDVSVALASTSSAIPGSLVAVTPLLPMTTTEPSHSLTSRQSAHLLTLHRAPAATSRIAPSDVITTNTRVSPQPYVRQSLVQLDDGRPPPYVIQLTSSPTHGGRNCTCTYPDAPPKYGDLFPYYVGVQPTVQPSDANSMTRTGESAEDITAVGACTRADVCKVMAFFVILAVVLLLACELT